MKARLLLLMGIGLFLGGAPALAQGIKSPAEVLPEKTIFYAEVRQPGLLAKEIASLLEGSYLSNIPESLAPLKAKLPAGRRHGLEEMGMVGLMFSPEVIQEVGRLKGAAVAITGLDKENRRMPEYVAVVLPGESNVPGFVARMAMATMAHGSFRSDGKTEVSVNATYERTEEVEGVGLYRMVMRTTTREEGAKPVTKQTLDPHSPAIALLPDAIVVGSPALVKDVLRRAKGKGEGKTLAGLDSFQKAASAAPGKGGLFAFVNPGPLAELIDGLDLPRGERQAFAIARKVVNPKAIRSASLHLTLDKGTFACREQIELDPREKSPLLELLPSGGIPRDLLAYVAPDGMAFGILSNEGGAKRWKQVIALADDIAKEMGERDPLPSEFIGQMEKAFDVDVGELLGKIKGVALTMPGVEHLLADAGKSGPPVCLMFSAVDAKAIDALADKTIPLIFAVLAKEKVEPASKNVKGYELSILETKRGYTLAYYRDGNRLLVSPEPMAIVGALEQAKKKGIRADEKLAARIDDLKDPIAVIMVRPITLGALWLLAGSSSEPSDPEVPGVPKGAKGVPRIDAEAKKFLDILKLEQPLMVSFSRSPEHITIDTTYPGLRPLVARLVDLSMEQALTGPGIERPMRKVVPKER